MARAVATLLMIGGAASSAPPQPRLPITGLRLFQRGLRPDEQVGPVEELGEDDAEGGRICCPLCGWRPTASSLWVCDDCGHPEYYFGGCGCVWNTFDTRGHCPGCGHRWRWTSCLYCGGWSPHEDWYATGPDDS